MALVTQNNPVAGPAIFNTFPSDILVEIFGYLSPKELGQACRVCKLWNALASQERLWNAIDLKKLFPKLSIIDEKVWKDHVDLVKSGLSFDDAQPLKKRAAILELKRLFAVLKVEDDAGITLMTIPKGLSFDKLAPLAGCPIMSEKSIDRYTWTQLMQDLGDITAQKTYRVAITTNIIVNTTDMRSYEQQDLVNTLGCEKPKMIEVMALAILTLSSSSAQSPLRLLFQLQTRCSEKTEEYSMVVGNFTPSSLRVDYVFNFRRSDMVGILARKEI